MVLLKRCKSKFCINRHYHWF